MKRIILLCSGLLLLLVALQAQSLSNLQNLNVDNLSDAQIGQLKQQMQAQGVSVNQIDQYAATKGASSEQAQKLKKRIVQYSGQEVKQSNRNQESEISNPTENEANNGFDSGNGEQNAKTSNLPKVFGTDIFKNAAMSFEPNLRLATPQDYVLGPDDEVLIDIYGLSEVSHKLYVSPEGTIRIPLVGVINVSGLTIAEARRVIKNRMTATYKGLASGNTSVSINLGNIRSITVHALFSPTDTSSIHFHIASE